jgi:hypothetical protein
VEVPPNDRAELEGLLRSPSLRAGLAQRARIVLLAADGVGTNEIVHRLGVSKPAVIRWKHRYAAEVIAGLDDRAKSRRPLSIDPMRIVLATLEPPPERLGVTHWSSRLLAHLGRLRLGKLRPAQVTAVYTAIRRERQAAIRTAERVQQAVDVHAAGAGTPRCVPGGQSRSGRRRWPGCMPPCMPR